MSTTPPDPPRQPPVPPGYQPGDYIPHYARDPHNPTPVAGQAAWGDQVAAQAQAAAAGAPVDPYRELYGWDAPARVNYASWGKRVAAYLFDSFLGMVSAVPFYIGYYQLFSSIETSTDVNGQQTYEGIDISGATVALLVVGGLISIAFQIYNVVIRQGRTGYTFGKTVVGIRLINERSGEPVGSGMSFVRQLAHFVDSLICYLGYLWPLWDAKNQTLADKMVGSVVIVRAQEEVL